MWRFVLVVGIVFAVSLVLWSTWRLDRRLFTGVSVALAIFGFVFGFGAWQGSQQALVVVPHKNLSFKLEDAKQLETGVRIKGNLHNNEAISVAIVTLQVNQTLCNDLDECHPADSETIVVRRHLNAGESAPISEVVRLLGSNKPNATSTFEVTILEAKGYKQAKGQSGLPRIK